MNKLTDDKVAKVSALNTKIQERMLRGAWQRNRGPARPEPIAANVWRWQEMLPLLLEAGEVAPIDETMRMRTLHMVNSDDTIPLGAARTFAAMLQHVNAGEVTDSHRHSATSIYFMIQGGGVYTTAEGEQQFMAPGDLLTQPTWTWHGSTNDGQEPAIWLTAMDTTLTQFLDCWFYEKYPAGRPEPITKPDGYHMKSFGPLRSSLTGVLGEPMPLKYRWSDTLPLLEELAGRGAIDPFDGVVLDYVDPRNGGPTTATLHCRLQLLHPGQKTDCHRHTSNTFYHVVRGAGVAQVGRAQRRECRLAWSERDCFNIPAWCWHSLENLSSNDPVILFAVNDRPIYEALRLYREEA